MRFVFACRVVTYGQITRRHFPKTKPVVARRRIRALADQGYFKTGVIELNGKVMRTVQPLPTTWSLIKDKWPFEVDRPHFKSESIEHDVRLTEILLRFEKMKCYRSFLSENLLQSSTGLANDPRLGGLSKIQPDGVLTIVDQKGCQRIYAVELELSRKSLELYRQKFIDYYLARGLDGVLYISSKPDIESAITNIDLEFSQRRESIMRFTAEKNVLGDSPKVIFSNQKMPTVDLW